MIAVGIVGVYIGKIYREVKHRPLYNIQELLDWNIHLNQAARYLWAAIKAFLKLWEMAFGHAINAFL